MSSRPGSTRGSATDENGGPASPRPAPTQALGVVGPASSAPPPIPPTGRGPLRTKLRIERVRRVWRSTHRTARRLVIAGAVITLIFLVFALAAPLIAPFGEAQFNGIPQLAHPSHSHIFGTTNLRYDVFSRVVFGTRLAFEVVLLSTLFAMAIGVPLGLLAGYSGRALDRVLVLVMDA